MMGGFRLPAQPLAGPFSGDKILCHPEIIAALMSGQVPPPVTVELDLTNACQLNCAFCTNVGYRQTNRSALTTAQALSLIADMARLGVKAVTFTGGGEPLLHRDAQRIMTAAKAAGLSVALITNGVLLDRVDLASLVTTCDWIRISLDAWDQDSYRQNKGADLWGHVICNTEQLARANADAGSPCTVGVGILTWQGVMHHAEKVVRVVAGLGANYVQFRPATFLPADERGMAFCGPDNHQGLESLAQYQRPNFKIYASMPKYADIGKPRTYRHCYGVYTSCVIGATGDIWACCHMRGNERFSIGNVAESSFAEIWGDVAKRQAVYERVGDFSECMPLCRFHRQNTLLDGINWHPVDKNFL